MASHVFILALTLTVVVLGALVTSASDDFDLDAWYSRGMGAKFDELEKRGSGLGSKRYVRCIKKGTNQRCFCDMLRSPKDPGYYMRCTSFSLKPKLEEE